MRLTKHEALAATLAYADVFHYPLTRQELIRWFLYYPVRPNGVPKDAGSKKKNSKAPWQANKWAIARRAGRWLCLIPTIQLVGVTGGLAMNNAARDDDIDLFFIVSCGTLWISRMLSTILVDILGLRRHPGDRHVANKVCLNMFMSQKAVGLPAADRDCFTAHEVLQMVPLWEQKGIYGKFLSANRWAETYLPNAWKEKKETTVPLMCASFPPVIWFMRLLEWPVKQLQLWYMARRRTREVITDTALRFHPKDARVWITKRLAVRLGRVGIPLDKVFYAG